MIWFVVSLVLGPVLLFVGVRMWCAWYEAHAWQDSGRPEADGE